MRVDNKNRKCGKTETNVTRDDGKVTLCRDNTYASHQVLIKLCSYNFQQNSLCYALILEYFQATSITKTFICKLWYDWMQNLSWPIIKTESKVFLL